MKTPLDLSVKELQEVMRTGQWPDGVDLSVIAGDKRLYKLTHQPHKLAKCIIQNRGATPEATETKTLTYIPNDKTLELKEKSLKLKLEKLEQAKRKNAQQTEFYKKLNTLGTRLSLLEDAVDEVKKAVHANKLLLLEIRDKA